MLNSPARPTLSPPQSLTSASVDAGVPTSKQQGFTLLELLVVITLIGIMAGAAMLSVGGQQARELKNEAQRLLLLLNQARDESELTQRTLGVTIGEQHYQFLEWQIAQRRWTLLETHPYQRHQLPSTTKLLAQASSPLNSHIFSDGSEVSRNPDHSRDDARELKPQIIFSASGYHSPFLVSLSSEEQRYQLSSDGYAATRIQPCSMPLGSPSSPSSHNLSVSTQC